MLMMYYAHIPCLLTENIAISSEMVFIINSDGVMRTADPKVGL